MAKKHERGLELIKSELQHHHPTFSSVTYFTYTYAQSIITVLELGMREYALELKQDYLEKVRDIDVPSMGKEFISGLILKEERSLEAQVEAKRIFREMIDLGDEVWFQLRIISITSLINILASEYETYEEEDVLEDLSKLVDHLSVIAKTQNLIRVRFEAGLMKSRLELAQRRVGKAKKILEELLEIAEKINFEYFINRIRVELDHLQANYNKWLELVKRGTSMKQMAEEAKIKSYMKQVMQYMQYIE